MPTLTSITITPTDPFVLVNTTVNFTATAHFSDAADLDVTQEPTTAWASSNTTIATITTSGTKGVATILTLSGSTIISVTYGDITATTILKVGLANYTRIIEQTVEAVKVGETTLTAAHNPISKLSVPYVSMLTGGVTFVNAIGNSDGPIGYTTVSGHPGDFSKLYIANEEQSDGYWVQLSADGYATTSFDSNYKNLGVVTSICLDAEDNRLTTAGFPVFVQIAGEAYVKATGPINSGDFLGPDVDGKVKMITFDPGSPTPILGFALENYSATFDGMVLMRIQICGE